MKNAIQGTIIVVNTLYHILSHLSVV